MVLMKVCSTKVDVQSGKMKERPQRNEGKNIEGSSNNKRVEAQDIEVLGTNLWT